MSIKENSDGPIWFCVRRKGLAVRSGWLGEHSLKGIHRTVMASPNEVVEVSVVNDIRPVPANRFSNMFFNRVRGIVGMEIDFCDKLTRFAPTQMLANNLGFERAVEKFLKQQKVSANTLGAEGSFKVYSARQYLLNGRDGSVIKEMHRGSSIIDEVHSIDELRPLELAKRIGTWMIVNQQPDGSIPYKYWPSRGAISPADNAIRRFLGSWSLARLGRVLNSSRTREAARSNLRSNLSRYFRDIGDGRGAIVEEAGAKLGASAIAGLAIMENHFGEEFREQLSMLGNGINSLAGGKEGFRTFFFPKERDGENWNFYSGEALLFWAESIRRGMPFAPSMERCSTTFEVCRARHLRKRNPAFVPWITQACVSLYKQSGRQEFVDFVFRANDWLLPMQQWGGLPLDMKGRFYDPQRPEFGPPHASSTGVYLEGIADALILARITGEQMRAELYERAICRGIRSLRQLQFRDEYDTYYISKKNRVLGALRTEVYDNAVRVDSAAHALMAALKVEELTKIRPLGPAPSSSAVQEQD